MSDEVFPDVKLTMTRRVAATAFTLAFLIGTALPAVAESDTLTLGEGEVRYSVYAPGWIWQGQNVNIMFVFESSLDVPATVTARFDFPPNMSDRFKYDGPMVRELTLPPGERKRTAFVNLLALASKPLPDGTVYRFRPEHLVFPLDIVVESSGGRATREYGYTLKSVRGAAVPEGPLATWLPVGLILLWCGLIFLIIPRMAEPGAWRRPSDPVDEVTAG